MVSSEGVASRRVRKTTLVSSKVPLLFKVKGSPPAKRLIHSNSSVKWQSGKSWITEEKESLSVESGGRSVGIFPQFKIVRSCRVTRQKALDEWSGPKPKTELSGSLSCPRNTTSMEELWWARVCGLEESASSRSMVLKRWMVYACNLVSCCDESEGEEIHVLGEKMGIWEWRLVSGDRAVLT